MSSSADTQTVDDLYREHHGWLHGWLRKRLGCSEVAADLTQDTFVRVLRSERAEPLQHSRQFLLTIAKGLSIDLFRRRSLERRYLEALAAFPEAHWPSEEQRAVALETLIGLDAMLAGLGTKVRDTFLLSQFEGLAYPQIAEVLNISPRTVNNYMAKAMEHCCLYRLEHSCPTSSRKTS